MRILFDQGTPVPLRRLLPTHDVSTAFERGWSTLTNGELLAVAEGDFLITTDQNLSYQQRLAGRSLAVLVLPTTNWLRIERHGQDIAREVESIRRGECRELRWQE